MKRKIGELYGVPVVVGDENEVGMNEIHYSLNYNEYIVLKKRDSSGNLERITEANGPLYPPTPPIMTSAQSLNDEIEEDEDIDEILNESPKVLED